MCWWYCSLTYRLTHQEKVKPTKHNKQTLTSYLRDSFRILIKSGPHRRNTKIWYQVSTFYFPNQRNIKLCRKKPLIPQRTAPGINSFWLSHIVKTFFCAPYCSRLAKFLQIICQSGCANLIDSHASLQRLHGCTLNIVAWVVELTYLHVVLKCESLLGGHGQVALHRLNQTNNIT